jgi:hypothetical protein
MFPPFILSTLFIAGVSLASAQAADVGVRTISVSAPERGGAIEVTVWYPTGAGGAIQSGRR